MGVTEDIEWESPFAPQHRGISPAIERLLDRQLHEWGSMVKADGVGLDLGHGREDIAATASPLVFNWRGIDACPIRPPTLGNQIQ